MELGIKLSHHNLANIIDNTRETVTVILGDLQVEKLLEMECRRVTLTDLVQLAKSVSVTAPAVASDPADLFPSRQRYGCPTSNTL